jgi:hypothetical protein
MQKKEFRYLNQLLIESIDFMEDVNDVQIDTPEYDQLGVGPMAVQKPKEDHRDAAMTLISEFVSSLEEIPAEKKT